MKHPLNRLSKDARFLSLGEEFYSIVNPTPFETENRLVHFNPAIAKTLGLAAGIEKDELFINTFSGKQPMGAATPFSMLYSGHQFGHYTPQLGDGRAIIIGEIKDKNQQPWELQLKGSGLTPYSRDGDGRAVLRSTIREYLCSEAMHGLGIPTTRALCITMADDEVYRENIEPGAMLTRVAPSHIRFGSFEIFYHRNQYQHVKKLADHVIKHHYPELENESQPYLLFLREVIERTASLLASWQAVGFAHGVMNTDNMSILGLTLDYGPYGFLDAYQPGFICNHSDYQGRYAFDQQPSIGLFNLSCLAQALLPLLHDVPEQAANIAREELEKYQENYIREYASLMRRKLGLETGLKEDKALLEDLLELMKQDRTDYTILFRRLSDFDSVNPDNNKLIRDLFIQREQFDQWVRRYQQRLLIEKTNDKIRQEKMKKINPKFILRNHLAENAIRKAEDDNDYSEINRLFSILQKPFDEHHKYESYADFPPEWAEDIAVSCSS